MKTAVEIEELKRQWRVDPNWDIETTEGFEDHHGQLLAYRLEMESRWDRAWVSALEEKAASLGCPGNFKLASYVIGLEQRIDALEALVQP